MMDVKMKRVWQIVGIVVLAGALLVGVGLSMGAEKYVYWDSQGITAGAEASVIEQLDIGEFENINIDISSANIKFVNSESYGFRIEDYDDGEYTWSLENGTLEIKSSGNAFFIFNIDLRFLFGDYKANMLTVYAPKDASFSDVKLKSSSGSIELPSMVCENLSVKASSGRVSVQDISTEKLCELHLSSGGLTASNIAADDLNIVSQSGRITATGINAGTLYVKGSSGSIHLEGTVAGSSEVHSSSGRVEALMDAKNLYVKCSSGSVEVNGSFTDRCEINASSGRVEGQINSGGLYVHASSGSVNISGELRGQSEIRASSGSVRLDITGSESDYSQEYKLSSGKLDINGKRMDSHYVSNNGAANSLKVNASSGSVHVNFLD